MKKDVKSGKNAPEKTNAHPEVDRVETNEEYNQELKRRLSEKNNATKNIRPSDEEIKRLHRRFVGDKFIDICNKQIAEIHEHTISKYKVVGNGLVKIYPKETKQLIDSINELCDNYIRDNYATLIEGWQREGSLDTSESKCNLQNVTNSNFVVKIDDTTAFGCSHHNHDKHRVYIDGLKYEEALMLQKIITNVIS